MREPDFPVPSQFHSKRKLQKGDALITEISGAYSGYSGQIHRTFSIGEGPTPEWQKMHDAAMEAFEVLSKVIKEGATTTEAEEAAEVIHGAATARTMIWFTASTSIRRSFRPRPANAMIPEKWSFAKTW